MSAPSANPGGEVLVYEAPDGSARVDVRLERETVWLTQRQMSELFESSIDNIGLHLKNIFGDGELEEPATTEDFSVVQSEGADRSAAASSTTTSTPSSRWAIASTPNAVCTFANGPRACCAST